MKNFLLSSAIVLTFTLPVVGQAEMTNSIPNQKSMPDKKWMISWTFGQTLGSPGKDLEKAMEESGFGDRTPRVTEYEYILGLIFENTYGGEQYTQRTPNKNFVDIHLTYSMTAASALALHVTHGPQAEVRGYDRHENEGNFLTLKTKGTYLSMDYILRTGVRNSGLSVGPILAFHQVAQESFENPQQEYHQKSVVPGIHAGYELAVVNSKDLFIGLNVNYNWFTKVQVGEITVGDPNVYTSVFKPATISLDNVNLGLTMGIKL